MRVGHRRLPARLRAKVVAALLLTLGAACGASPAVEREVAARRAAALAAQSAAAPSPGAGAAAVDASGGGVGATAATGPAQSNESRPGAGQAARSAGPVAGPLAPGTAATQAGAQPAAPGVGAPSQARAASGAAPAAATAQGNGGATDVGITATGIKIGSLFFNGGYLDKYSQVSEQAATAYFRYVNDQGGIHGRKIEYLTCDTAGNADGTQSCLRKLANDDKVFAMGPSLDFNLDTVQPFLAEKKLPWIGTSGLYPSEFESPWMFPTQIRGGGVGGMIATFSKKKLGVATVGVSYLTDGAGPTCTEAVRQVGQRLGFQVVVTVENNQTQGDLTQQALTMRSKNPDAVLFCNDPINTVKFIQAGGRIGYKPPKGWVGGFVAADDVPMAAGAAAVGMYGFTAYDFYRSDTPGLREYHRITEYYYPSIFHHFYTQAAYTGARAMVEAMRKAGPNLTRAGLVAALRTMTDFDSGMGLRLDFSNLGAARSTGLMLQADGDLRWQVVSERFTEG